MQAEFLRLFSKTEEISTAGGSADEFNGQSVGGLTKASAAGIAGGCATVVTGGSSGKCSGAGSSGGSVFVIRLPVQNKHARKANVYCAKTLFHLQSVNKTKATGAVYESRHISKYAEFLAPGR